MTVWTRPEVVEKNHTALTLEVASNAVVFYTEYFDVTDALPPKIGN